MGFIGYALIKNFQGVYIITIILILNLYLIVLLEEKELINRFGDVYAEYSKSVLVLSLSKKILTARSQIWESIKNI